MPDFHPDWLLRTLLAPDLAQSAAMLASPVHLNPGRLQAEDSEYGNPAHPEDQGYQDIKQHLCIL